MRFGVAALALAVMLAGITAAGSASARGGHGHGHGPRVSFGFVFGPPAFWGYPYSYPYYYYPPPHYYYPPVVTTPPAPTTYIERGDAAPQEQAQGTWYYCPEARAYYPYVKQCAGGWQKVAPQPQAER